MARVGLDKNLIVERAAGLANEMGLDNITLRLIKSMNLNIPVMYCEKHLC